MNRYRLDENKNPVLCANEEEFNRWHMSVPEEDRTGFGCRVARWEDKSRGLCVSTVFLSLDTVWEGEPVLFETLITDDEEEANTIRYSTWEEAQRGHDDLVQKLQRGYLTRSGILFFGKMPDD